MFFDISYADALARVFAHPPLLCISLLAS